MKETLYAQVARDLEDGIVNGRYPVGSLLPTELELCAHYGASRHTVRSAIQELQDSGLVSRRKKVGTRVEASSKPDSYRQSLGSVDDLVQFGAAHQRVVKDIVEIVADRALAQELGCEPGTRWLRVSSLRLDGRKDSPPIGWTDTYIDAAYADLSDIIRASSQVLISTLIETHHGRRIAEIHQDVQAVPVPAALAQALETPAGSPALKIVRRYLDPSNAAFEISISLHPMDRFTFSMRLTRDKGPA
ncbi:MAG: GntR family transcriptional regulator [Pseudomonadota bacterium]